MGADNANLARATISLEAEKIAKWAHARFLEPNTILNHISIDTREGPLHAEEDILTKKTIFANDIFLEYFKHSFNCQDSLFVSVPIRNDQLGRRMGQIKISNGPVFTGNPDKFSS